MGSATTRHPSLPVNHTAFQCIDTMEKAYLIGFLLADGCVREPAGFRTTYRVNLRILAQDLKVCQRIQKLAGGHLRVIEYGYRVEWDVTSDALAADLIALGVTPRKSLTASLKWKRIPPELHGAVLAGLIDGDGHLRFSKKDRRAEISLVTASPVLKDQLLERFPFFKAIVIPTGKGRKRDLYTVIVETNRDRLCALNQVVYGDLPFAILDRKQAVLDAIRASLVAQDEYDYRINQVGRLKACGLTIEDIAARLGTSRNPICRRLKLDGIDSRKTVFTAEDRQEMQRLHDQGLTVLQIHAAIGKGTEQAVRWHLQRRGCLTRKPKPQTRHQHADEVLMLHREGMPAYRISAHLGIGIGLVASLLNMDGITLVSGAPQKLFQDQVVWADAELSKGRTLRSVAEALGVSGTLVKIRRRQLLAEREKAEACADVDEGAGNPLSGLL